MCPAKPGFIFFDLLMTVLIASVLAGVAVPAYQTYIVRGQVAEAYALWMPIRENIADYYAVRGEFPDDNRAAGLAPPDKLAGSYVEAVVVEAGAITVHFATGSNNEIAGRTLTLRPGINIVQPTAPLFWLCADETREGVRVVGEDRSDLPQKFRASICR